MWKTENREVKGGSKSRGERKYRRVLEVKEQHMGMQERTEIKLVEAHFRQGRAAVQGLLEV